jgi:transposase
MMGKSLKFAPEVQERAVHMVFDAKGQYPSQWAAIESIAAKIGCKACAGASRCAPPCPT